ncbi:MAG: hypothetical protein AAGF59_04630 [Pseudomonadota bacterium]
MPFWQRLAITVAVMLVSSFIAGYVWSALVGFALPSYIAGLIGGLTALPTWHFLQRVKLTKAD